VTTPSNETPVRGIGDIPGWFGWLDQQLFEQFLGEDAVVQDGDLVEVGVYLGKSAVLIGRFKRPEETFTVCDLFGAEARDQHNQRENDHSYSKLSRERFERNYLALHDELPVIVQDLSSAIVDHVRPASARFVHVDASHLYEHVATDVDCARTILKPDAIVCFDDFRNERTPGVAAAVWEAVFTKGLHPVCLTPRKFYGTFGDPTKHQHQLNTWLAQERQEQRIRRDVQHIAGAPVLRLSRRKVQKPPQPSLSQRIARRLRSLGS
jgi:hypothetical protein